MTPLPAQYPPIPLVYVNTCRNNAATKHAFHRARKRQRPAPARSPVLTCLMLSSAFRYTCTDHTEYTARESMGAHLGLCLVAPSLRHELRISHAADSMRWGKKVRLLMRAQCLFASRMCARSESGPLRHCTLGYVPGGGCAA